MLSMGQAATEAGVSKSTLSRAIKSGRLSAVRNDQGGFSIDPAELFRVYPRNPTTRSGNGNMAHHATGMETAAATALQAEIDGLKAQLALMRERADELKEDRDTWRHQAEAMRLLVDQRPRRSMFGWLKAS